MISLAFPYRRPLPKGQWAVAYVCTTNYHKLILMQATAERAMGGGFRWNSDSELKLKNRSTGSTVFVGSLIPVFWTSGDISSLGFKARVGSLIRTWQRHTWCIFPEIHLWCNTCQPLGGQHCSCSLPHMPVSAEVGCLIRLGDLPHSSQTC